MEFVNDTTTFWCHVCDMSVSLPTTTTVVACPHCCSDLLELMDSSSESYPLDLHRLIHHLSSTDDDDVIPPPPVNINLLPASKAYVDVIPTVRMTSATMCGVCKEQFAEGKELTCGHVYHGECILPWLSSRSSCPLCRFQLPTDDLEQNVDQQRLQRLVHYRHQINP